MEYIEPNIAVWALFALFAYVTFLGLIVMTGAFPLATRPELKRPLGLGLVIANCFLLALALFGTFSFGFEQLRWTSMVIAAGFALLFAPGLFNIWPTKWRDGPMGLFIVLIGLSAVIATQTALA